MATSETIDHVRPSSTLPGSLTSLGSDLISGASAASGSTPGSDVSLGSRLISGTTFASGLSRKGGGSLERTPREPRDSPCSGVAASRARRCFLPRTPCTGFAPSRARRCFLPRPPCTRFEPSRARRCASPRTPCTGLAASRARRSLSPGTPCKSTLPCPSRAGTTDLAVPSPPPSAFACQDSSACRRAFARSVVLAERNDESTAGLSVLFSSDPTTHDPNNARFFRARASHRPTRPRSSLRLTRSRASSMRGRRGPLVTPSVAELGDSLPGDDLRADIPSTWRADLATAAASTATEPVATSETRCVPTRVPAPRLNRPRALTPRTRRSSATSRPPPPLAS